VQSRHRPLVTNLGQTAAFHYDECVLATLSRPTIFRLATGCFWAWSRHIEKWLQAQHLGLRRHSRRADEATNKNAANVCFQKRQTGASTQRRYRHRVKTLTQTGGCFRVELAASIRARIGHRINACGPVCEGSSLPAAKGGGSAPTAFAESQRMAIS
jgi:hypothetical protein